MHFNQEDFPLAAPLRYATSSHANCNLKTNHAHYTNMILFVKCHGHFISIQVHGTFIHKPSRDIPTLPELI